MAFQSYVDPIATLVDRYFEKRRTLQGNENTGEAQELKGAGWDSEGALPEFPEVFVRDENNRVVRIIHGDISTLENAEEEMSIWQEEFIRNTDGIVEEIRKTYPDGSTSTERFVRENGKVARIEAKEG